MSASPTRVAYPEPVAPSDSGFPLHEGNHVLESLAQQQSLPALLAFSALHEHIRNRPSLDGESDLFQTERFVLNEVLQLNCSRVQELIDADGVMVALVEGQGVTCYAAAGPLLMERGVRLENSEFLQDCLDSGRILRCDDCQVDTRVELDLSRQLGARATVIVPLQGRRNRLGVLQAFSRTPFAFSDDDVRCLDLFAELILSALKPEDEDRRVNWLADVADQILKPKLVAQTPASAVREIPAERAALTQLQPTVAEEPVPADETPSALEFFQEPGSQVENEVLIQPGTVQEELPAPTFTLTTSTAPLERIRAHFWSHLTAPVSSRPGLSVVLVLIMVAGLFSIGVWWGMYDSKAGITKSAALPAATKDPTSTASTPSDHLLDQITPDSQPATSSAVPSKLSKVTGVRHWSSTMGSTVVIDMEDQVQYEVHRLASPERIYFDLHDTSLASDLRGKVIDIGDSLLTRLRVAQPESGVTRVVLDTKDGSNFAVSMESNPYRIVVQLRGSEGSATSTKVMPRSEAKRSLSPLPAKPDRDLVASAAGKFRIVLDAGHGGWDLGTVGRQGLLEKDLVLDVTERLGKLLQSRLGARVIFTRTSDNYLPLDQRADIANQSQADLFVSVHANYSSSAAARGVETYYTNFFSPPGSKEIEKRENGVALRPVSVALSAGDLHDKIEESRRLAASIQHSLYGKLSATNPGIRDRGIKDSAFVVLTGTRMPAILTEISFVSSPADEHNLQSEAYRQQIAEALYKGIAQYEAGSHRVKLAEVHQNVQQR